MITNVRDKSLMTEGNGQRDRSVIWHIWITNEVEMCRFDCMWCSVCDISL